MENEILDYVMETPGNTNPVILKQMLDANSGTKLPEPTPDDNGKVLGVSEGQYALVSGGGGGSVEPLIVTIGDNGIDATYNEIKSAVLAGRAIYALSEQDSEIEHTAFYSVLTEFSAQEYDGVASYSAIFQNDSFMASDPDVDMVFSE